MSWEIAFEDANTGAVEFKRSDRVPAGVREVLLRDGVEVEDPALADERVPIVRVVKLDLDAAGRPAPRALAARRTIQEFDAAGQLRRESVLFPR